MANFRNANDLLTAAQALLAAKENQMETAVEWDGLRRAVRHAKHHQRSAKPEVLMDESLRECLSPEAIAVIAGYLQPAKSKDPAADRQVFWFYQRLVALLGADEFRRLQDELSI